MYRLSRSVYAKEVVVKGAMLLRVWTGEQYRPTKDLDLLAILDKSPEELNQIFRNVCTLTVEDDGLVFLARRFEFGRFEKTMSTEACGFTGSELFKDPFACAKESFDAAFNMS
jgi:hypothetical protein